MSQYCLEEGLVELFVLLDSETVKSFDICIDLSMMIVELCLKHTLLLFFGIWDSFITFYHN